MWALVLGTTVGLISCGGGMPQVEQTSYETVTIKKEDITVPIKFSAKLKGETDVTITPQVSGQLMKICVIEGDQVKKGQVLFIIDQRDAQLEPLPRSQVRSWSTNPTRTCMIRRS